MSFTRLFTFIFSALVLVFSVQAYAAQPGNPDLQTTATATAAVSDKVNINTASIDELKTLKGVGATKAQAIIDYRTQHGAFKSAEDLGNVKGFSGKILENLLKNNTGRIVTE
jgi:competence protein ComEA